MCEWKVGQRVRLLPYNEDVEYDPGWVDYDEDSMEERVGTVCTLSWIGSDIVCIEDSKWNYSPEWFEAVEELEYV